MKNLPMRFSTSLEKNRKHRLDEPRGNKRNATDYRYI